MWSLMCRSMLRNGGFCSVIFDTLIFLVLREGTMSIVSV